MKLWMIWLVSSRSPPRGASAAVLQFYTPARRSAAQNASLDINDRRGRFDPDSTAKWRPCRPIMGRAAAVRRHAVCSAALRADITKKIRYIIENDAIVTWLDLIMVGQYGPRGF
jgi:hypothetical protein